MVASAVVPQARSQDDRVNSAGLDPAGREEMLAIIKSLGYSR